MLEVALDGDLHLVVDAGGCVVETVVDVEEEYAETGVRWGQRGWGCEGEAELAAGVCERLQVAGVARNLGLGRASVGVVGVVVDCHGECNEY